MANQTPALASSPPPRTPAPSPLRGEGGDGGDPRLPTTPQPLHPTLGGSPSAHPEPVEGLDLGIDTASDDASLALLDASGEVAAQRSWHAASTMSRELLGQVDALLRDAGAARAQIARIAVNVGPGQYGALRSGIATAQGLALALDAPLAAVGRLEADALPHLAAGGPPVVAVHDTRNGVAWAAYEHDASGAPREVAPPRIDPPAEAARTAPRPSTWCGEVSDELRAALDGASGVEVRVDVRDAEDGSGDTTGAAVRAVSLVRIARARDAFGDPAAVDAIYLRPPSITRPRTP